MRSIIIKKNITVGAEVFVLLALLGKWMEYQTWRTDRVDSSFLVHSILPVFVGWIFMFMVFAGVRSVGGEVCYRMLFVTWPSILVSFFLVLALSHDLGQMQKSGTVTKEYGQYMMNEGVTQACAEQWVKDELARINSERQLYVIVLVLCALRALRKPDASKMSANIQQDTGNDK